MANYRKHVQKPSYSVSSDGGSDSDRELANVVKSAIDNCVEYVKEATSER